MSWDYWLRKLLRSFCLEKLHSRVVSFWEDWSNPVSVIITQKTEEIICNGVLKKQFSGSFENNCDLCRRRNKTLCVYIDGWTDREQKRDKETNIHQIYSQKSIRKLPRGKKIKQEDKNDINLRKYLRKWVDAAKTLIYNIPSNR